MSPELQHLIQLQDLDLALERERQRIEQIPLDQQALEARVAAATAALADVKERIAASTIRRREVEKDLAAVQSRLSKFKEQIMAVKTNKEYHAMQKELAVAETEIRSHEDRLLDQMEEAEKLAAEMKAAEAALKQEQAAVATAERALAAERAALEAEIGKAAAARSELAAKIPREAMAIFERVAHGRRGIAVAEARDGLCTVCHVRLRPQVFNEVRRNDGIHQCESCTRILYYVPPAPTPTA